MSESSWELFWSSLWPIVSGAITGTIPLTVISFVLGLALALWSASGYVAAFSRGMNRVYEIDEGRPVWKLRPVLLAVTLVLVVIAVAIIIAAVLSGGVARSVGDIIGLSDASVTVWNIDSPANRPPMRTP